MLQALSQIVMDQHQALMDFYTDFTCHVDPVFKHLYCCSTFKSKNEAITEYPATIMFDYLIPYVFF